MAGFDYANARLRAMKARLFTRGEMEDMAGSKTYGQLINALVESHYRQALEPALVRTGGRQAIMEALHEDVINTLGKVKVFFRGKHQDFVMLALRSYDVHNLKTILRGLDTGVHADEIARSLVPVGRISAAILDELAQASSPREAIDRMATLRLPAARPLLDLRAERPGAMVFEMEVALEQWHDQDARQRLEKAPKEFQPLSEALDIEADILNVLTALRFAHAPEERERLKDLTGTDEVGRLFVGPGKLSFDKLTLASEQESVGAAIEILVGRPYEDALRNGLRRFERTGRLSDIEDQLVRFQLGWRSKLVRKDPLGIGVLLTYVALKINEVKNIRRIALGIDIGSDSEAILESMVFAG